MKEIGMPELKRIQMDILSAVDSFCNDNNITYSMAYGTLLGAVRHRGYIPWDDDIDICMMRDDYERFVESFPDLMDGHYKIASYKRTPNWHTPFSKVYDSRTSLRQKKAKTIDIGVNIDVFPLDEVPEDVNLWRKFWKYQKHLLDLRDLKAIKIVKERSMSKNLILILLKMIYSMISQKSIVKKLDERAQQFNGMGSSLIYPNLSGITKAPLQKAMLSDIAIYKFENRDYKGFKNADYYLSMTYGDYMKLPPESERVGKHGVYACWK